MEWPDFYDAGHREDLLRFYDHYLKGIDNGWQETPRVRYAVLDLEGGDRINQPAGAFPPEGFAAVKLYLDAAGEPLEQFNVPNHGPQMDAMTRNGAAILKYKVSNGRLRVSMRHLDEVKSTDSIPVHSFDRVEKLAPAEIVCVDIDLFPVALALHPGEHLRLVVSGFHILGGVFSKLDNVKADNHGRHAVRTGGRFASFIQLPMKAAVGK